MLWKCLVVVLVVFSLLACGADEEDDLFGHLSPRGEAEQN